MELVSLVINGTVIAHGEEYWHARSGIPTGLPPSSTIANLVLVDMDRHIAQHLGSRIHRVRRYIDGVFTIDNASNADFNTAGHCWMEGITTEPTSYAAAADKEVVYLDLSVKFDAEGRLGFRLFEKPLS